MEINYISIYDNTAEAKFLFVSESVTDVLGFLPEELVGMGGYELTHPDERIAINLIHSGNVKNERLSTVVTCRSRHKDGHYIQCDVVIHYCYDTLVCTNFAIISPNCIKHTMRMNSADTAFSIQPDGSLQLKGAWNIEQKRIKTDLAQKEPRFCLFLNRYTTQSIIVFATRMSKALVGLDPIECIGNSLYDYIDPKDKKNVMSQVELSKSSDVIARVRFGWVKPNSELLDLQLQCLHNIHYTLTYRMMHSI
ncbi:uncharacterized protein BX663DRAFT_500908 [Cokeromyces recurvatus]|uniref:uncharacterized protein n=1 Tax=Cokeromyces recurvatus TaxID=90255 RepID=UPI0022209E0C|nr:uncharacterized protein BX663DRAFT_500908 [Cokeromyces recurvatus]KAI7905786.1 hypothetical protein BX663DRAFT_500908 [Cokeromyces recurvatus]